MRASITTTIVIVLALVSSMTQAQTVCSTYGNVTNCYNSDTGKTTVCTTSGHITTCG
jgi:hypothetical protein